MGRFLVSGVMRALEPWVMSTYSPSPAPRVSTATNVRPVVTRPRRLLGSTRYGSTTSSLCPTIESTFCVATSEPVTLARNMDVLPYTFQELFGLSGDNQLFVRGYHPQLNTAVPAADSCFALGRIVGRWIKHDAQFAQPAQHVRADVDA